jgi:hypothetical protein
MANEEKLLKSPVPLHQDLTKIADKRLYAEG